LNEHESAVALELFDSPLPLERGLLPRRFLTWKMDRVGRKSTARTIAAWTPIEISTPSRLEIALPTTSSSSYRLSKSKWINCGQEIITVGS
jgi:hypothetical protein